MGLIRNVECLVYANDYLVNLGNLQGIVTISDSGTSGSDDLNVNGTNNPDVINKTATQITLGNPVTETIDFDGIENITVNGRGGNDTITDPGTNTILLGGLGDDTIIVNATFGNGVVVDGEEGADTIIIELGDLDGPVMVTDSGTTGVTTIHIIGTAADDQMTLSATQLIAGNEVVTFDFDSGEISLRIDGMAGEDQIRIADNLPAGVTFQLESITQIVDIDVKPGSSKNTLNLASNGVLPVVLFTTGSFNAALVDVSTVSFAGAGVVQSVLEDIDGDGDLDLILHFRVDEMDDLVADYISALLLDLEDGELDDNHQSVAAVLSGQTSDGSLFAGTDVLDAFFAGHALKDLLANL